MASWPRDIYIDGWLCTSPPPPTLHPQHCKWRLLNKRHSMRGWNSSASVSLMLVSGAILCYVSKLRHIPPFATSALCGMLGVVHSHWLIGWLCYWGVIWLLIGWLCYWGVLWWFIEGLLLGDYMKINWGIVIGDIIWLLILFFACSPHTASGVMRRPPGGRPEDHVICFIMWGHQASSCVHNN